ncbi:MAG: hypothetical protein COB65_07270 [Thalassobium sp.]|uniref:hypothetical protein n=1 Tax=Octadecabacter sp. SW4 TaxID=2602067 RepID=UPI000C0C7A58|nr:hypothetical protein [Octadecabacter sp. SW4]PHQ83240.1 MAG: hypothetical protein COB65_07270 [Thalassobium sp.]QEE35829.1 hypothetical protein FTO60_09000 [Octadecabacter sp. SW4]|tara:strand:- start:45 stop:386 length:342 start_codon:yes stop_codon:yes gene_type:complete
MKRTSIALALVASLGVASVATAADYNYFGLQGTQDASSNIDVGLVRAATDGTVQIYSYNGGETGALLGETAVHAGANPDVAVNVGAQPVTNVIAVLYDESGNAVADQVLTLAR